MDAKSPSKDEAGSRTQPYMFEQRTKSQQSLATSSARPSVADIRPALVPGHDMILPGSSADLEAAKPVVSRTPSIADIQKQRLDHFDRLMKQFEDEVDRAKMERHRRTPKANKDPFSLRQLGDLTLQDVEGDFPSATLAAAATASAAATATPTGSPRVRRRLPLTPGPAWPVTAPSERAASPSVTATPRSIKVQPADPVVATPPALAPRALLTAPTPFRGGDFVLAAPTPFAVRGPTGPGAGAGQEAASLASEDSLSLSASSASLSSTLNSTHGQPPRLFHGLPYPLSPPPHPPNPSAAGPAASTKGPSPSDASVEQPDSAAAAKHAPAATEETPAPLTVLDLTPDALMQAALAGNLARIAALLKQGLSVNVVDGERRTALIFAAHAGHTECVRLLVNQGIAIDAQASDGTTALHWAVFNGHETIASLLLLNGARTDLRDCDGRLALHWATNAPTPAVVKLLVKGVADADVNVRDDSGMTPLLWAAFYNRIETVEKLVKYGANVAAVDYENRNALMWAACENATQVIPYFLTHEFMACRDSRGCTALHLAAQSDCTRAVKAILAERPGSHEEPDNSGRTALHWAAAAGAPRALRLLLEIGANIEAEDKLGCTPFDYAQRGQHTACIELLDAAAPLPALIPRAQSQEAPTISEEIMSLLRVLTAGGYLLKHTNGGKGAAHQRFFWLDVHRGALCWCKSGEVYAEGGAGVSSVSIDEVFECPSPPVQQRDDINAPKYRFSFHVVGDGRIVDVAAPSETAFRLWVDGLKALSQLKHVTRTAAVSS